MTTAGADAVATLRLFAGARRDYLANSHADDAPIIAGEAAAFAAVADTLDGQWRWADLIGVYAPSWRWSLFGDHDPRRVMTAPAGTAGGHIHQDHEDRKGLSGIDGYEYGNKVLEEGGRSHGASRRDPHGSGRFIATDEAARFWAKVRFTPGGCWLWTGALSPDGYGRFRITLAPGRHTHVKAHRWAWEQLVGPIGPGMTLDHLIDPGPCTSKACVNPGHLEEVTRAENARRAATRRARNQRNKETGLMGRRDWSAVKREADLIIVQALHTVNCDSCGHPLADHTPPAPGRLPPCYRTDCTCHALVLPEQGAYL
jgi:hypothetical protein